MKKYNVKEVMEMAWSLAKTWANNKGGKAVEYISGALKQAWRVAKVNYINSNGLQGVEGNTIYLCGSKRQPMYLAIIDGLSTQYGLNRKFIPSPNRGTDSHEFELEEGKVYNWRESRVQFFGKFVKGQMIPLSQQEVTAIFS